MQFSAQLQLFAAIAAIGAFFFAVWVLKSQVAALRVVRANARRRAERP